MEIISGIYKITCSITNKFYIGSSKNIKRRWKDHRKITTRVKYKDYPLYKDMNIYGLENFKFEVLEECYDIENLKELEYSYIKKLKPQYNRGKPWSNNTKNTPISGVYIIKNIITNDFYIGSSKNIKNRWDNHRKSYHYKNNPKTPLYIAFHDYGLNNFSFSILEQCGISELFVREQYYIDTLKPTYNVGRAKASLSPIEYQRDYNIKHKDQIQQYKEKNKKYIANRNKKYFSRKCFYNNKILTLSQLSNLFVRQKIKNPVQEAKKYLIEE